MKSKLLEALLKFMSGAQLADSMFDESDLKQGTLIEMEHTTNREVAKSIAKDHLKEDKDYYRKLKKAGL